MAFTVFDWVKEITERKRDWNSISDDEKQSFNPWMINKCLSMYEPYIELVAYVQRYWLLTPEQLYKIYTQYFPQQKIYYSYIKSKNKKPNEELVKAISTYYQTSFREAKQYLKILSKQEQISILKALGNDDEKIKEIYGKI